MIGEIYSLAVRTEIVSGAVATAQFRIGVGLGVALNLLLDAHGARSKGEVVYGISTKIDTAGGQALKHNYPPQPEDLASLLLRGIATGATTSAGKVVVG